MARLPSEKFLIQNIGDDVMVFEDGSEREIARWPAKNPDKMVDGMKAVSEDDSLSVVDKAFAHFWAGYFYAHMVYPEIGDMPEWAKTGWAKGPDTSKSLLPGTQWGLNAAYKSDQAALSREDSEDVEGEFHAWLMKMDELYPGIDFTLIPRPSWETTGLVGSVEDIQAVVADLEDTDAANEAYARDCYEDGGYEGPS